MGAGRIRLRFSRGCGLAAGLLAAAAPAQDPPPPPPAFDIAQSCARTPDSAGCQQVEEQARARLAVLWPGLPPRKRARCEARARGAGDSYVAALSCARR